MRDPKSVSRFGLQILSIVSATVYLTGHAAALPQPQQRAIRSIAPIQTPTVAANKPTIGCTKCKLPEAVTPPPPKPPVGCGRCMEVLGVTNELKAADAKGALSPKTHQDLAKMIVTAAPSEDAPASEKDLYIGLIFDVEKVLTTPPDSAQDLNFNLDNVSQRLTELKVGPERVIFWMGKLKALSKDQEAQRVKLKR